MALYAIGDTHLSLSADKSMEAFGEGWANYVERLREGFAALGERDVCVLCGDLSWAMNLEEAREDFRFLASLGGKKLIVKGNHDYWFSTAAKAQKFFASEGLTGLEILHNNCCFYGDWALCGTRGWFFEEERGDAHDRKIMLREIGRLETSLKAAGEREKLVFLHYPPIYQRYECPEILELFERYGVRKCYYGHIHGKGIRLAFNGERNGTEYRLVSADAVGFTPVKVLDQPLFDF